MNSKKRTAIIVGVAIGGVALFAIGFFASRQCKKRGEFKVMKVRNPLKSSSTRFNEENYVVYVVNGIFLTHWRDK